MLERFKLFALAKADEVYNKYIVRDIAKELALVPRDYRVDRSVKTFDIPDEQLVQLYDIFQRKLDILQVGKAGVETVFEKWLGIKRNLLTDAMLAIINSKEAGSLTFGEFMELTCTFVCFEQKDLVKFCFFAVDTYKLGNIDKNELRHFVYDMWDNNVTSNIHVALDYLETHDDGDGQYSFEEVWDMVS